MVYMYIEYWSNYHKILFLNIDSCFSAMFLLRVCHVVLHGKVRRRTMREGQEGPSTPK